MDKDLSEGKSLDKLMLPRSSVKRIMKLNSEVKVISAEAVVEVTKATGILLISRSWYILMKESTELFISMLVNESHQIALANNRKTIKFEDLIVACIYFVY
jgi:histone H3/H4